MQDTFKLAVECKHGNIEAVGHRSSGPLGLSRLTLGHEDAVVLKLTDAEALKLVLDLTRALEFRAAKREKGF